MRTHSDEHERDHSNAHEHDHDHEERHGPDDPTPAVSGARPLGGGAPAGSRDGALLAEAMEAARLDEVLEQLESLQRSRRTTAAQRRHLRRVSLSVHRQREAVIQAGLAAVAPFLKAWASGKRDRAIRQLHEASAREVIEGLRAGRKEIEAELARRKRRNAQLLALAQDLGAAGARIFLRALLAV